MARLGIYASQKALDTTGNNIANINTEGYSRQGIKQRSLILGGSDRYMSKNDARVGCGTIVTGTAQLRDPYLDIRYRNEMSNVGAMDAKLAGLQNIADVLDEVASGEDGEGVLEAQFNDLMEQMQNLVTQGAGRNEYDTLVRSSAKSLVSLFHDYSKRLETLRSQQEARFKQDLEEVNGILENIAHLNESIRKSNLYGADALEQKDERNLLIDKLSEYVRFDAIYEKEDLGAGLIVDKLVIKLKGNDISTPEAAKVNNATLVDGIYFTQLDLDMVKDANGNDTDQISSNYGITLRELRDTRDRVMKSIKEEGKFVEDFIIGDGAGQYADDEAAIEAAKAKMDELYALQKTDKDAGKNYIGYKYEKIPMKNPDDTPMVDAEGNRVYGYRLTEHPVTVSQKVPLMDNTLYGALQSERELLTEQGEFATKEQSVIGTTDEEKRVYDPNALTKRGYPYYQKAIDALANKFAEMMNEANKTVKNAKFALDADGNYQLDDGVTIGAIDAAIANGKFFIKDKDGNDVKATSLADFGYNITTDEELKAQLAKGEHMTDFQILVLMPEEKGGLGLGKYEDLKGGTLISNGQSYVRPVPDDPDDPAYQEPACQKNINASNITISDAWASGDVRIITSREFNAGSTANDNIDHLLSQLMNGEFEFMPGAVDYTADDPNDVPANTNTAFYKGSLQGMLTNTWELLSNDQKTTSEMLLNYTTSSDELYVDRDAVMGVDLNDEAMNMIHYQKSYSAACRFMTTIDEILDKLINNTGRCGL